VKAVVVGGGAAGLTAALVLARARHQVTVIDDQTYRNATVEEFHGFPTRDATSPNRFRADAIRDLRAYGVVIVNSGVISVVFDADRYGLTIEFAEGTTMHADALLLATGVHDDLPPISGLAERWGKSVFNCPFCDGWEHRDQPVVVIDAAPGSDHLASMIRSWTTEVTVVRANAVAAVTGEGAKLSQVVLCDGSTLDATAAFVKAPVTPRSGIARHLGCDLDPDGYIVTNHAGATSHSLVWAAGDVRRPAPMPHQVVLAAADGSAAAIDMHKACVAGNVGRVRGLRDQARAASTGD
jgi:thioredoxin reductase